MTWPHRPGLLAGHSGQRFGGLGFRVGEAKGASRFWYSFSLTWD